MDMCSIDWNAVAGFAGAAATAFVGFAAYRLSAQIRQTEEERVIRLTLGSCSNANHEFNALQKRAHAMHRVSSAGLSWGDFEHLARSRKELSTFSSLELSEFVIQALYAGSFPASVTVKISAIVAICAECERMLHKAAAFERDLDQSNPIDLANFLQFMGGIDELLRKIIKYVPDVMEALMQAMKERDPNWKEQDVPAP